MIWNLFKKSKTQIGSKYFVGETFCYRESVLMIVDKRYSKLAGYEYMVLLEGDLHGWINHTILDSLTKIGTTAK